jgi:hypothetical protein
MIDAIEQTEGSTGTVTGPIRDEHGAIVTAAKISSFKVTLACIETDPPTIVNERYEVDLYGGGSWAYVDGIKATIDAEGDCTIRLAAEDNVLLPNSTRGERHALIVEVGTGTTPASNIRDSIEFFVKKIAKPAAPPTP